MPREDGPGSPDRLAGSPCRRRYTIAAARPGTVSPGASVADAADPTRMAPELDSGDHLHPIVAGYEAMGAAVDLALFSLVGNR